MYFNDDKRKRYPRICAMGNPKAANEMIVALAAGWLAGDNGDSISQAVKKAADAVEEMMEYITAPDQDPSLPTFDDDDEGDGGFRPEFVVWDR